MKFFLHTLIFSFFVTLSQAQPELLSSEMLPFGSTMTEKAVKDLSIIDTTIQGGGVVWNFSAITTNTVVPNVLVTVTDPALTPYADSFPAANYSYKEVRGTSTSYQYFILSGTKMERVGSYVSNLNTYNDPQTEYVFPLALDTVNHDTWDNTNSSTGGTYDLVCIGAGTLMLPGGKSYNALLLRVHRAEGTIEYDSYFWYSADNGAALLSYTAGDGFFIAKSAAYLGLLTIDVEESTFIAGLRYNNPVENSFVLNFQSKSNADCSYAVLNSLGQKVFLGGVKVIAGNTETLNIDFSHFPSGIYSLSIQSGQASKAIKILKTC